LIKFFHISLQRIMLKVGEPLNEQW
jgi:hypothetical protein